MAIASFGNKTFSVSNNRIYTFEEFSRTGTLNIEEQEVEGQKPSTYIKGSALDEISFKVTLFRQKGLDVRSEIDSWMAIKDSKVPYMLILGNKPVTTNKFLLTSVSESEASFDRNGNYLRVVIQLQFKEFVRAGAKKQENDTEANASSTKKSIKRGSSKKRRKSKKRTNKNVSTAKSKGTKMKPGRKLLIQKQKERY